MSRNDDSRLLILGSMLGAFVLGTVFGAVGMALRPRTVLAPAPPGANPVPQPLASAPEPGAGDPPAPAMADGEDLADSLPGNGTHTAPDGYPVKGNERSGIYHVPGGLAYDRTVADVFFRTPEAAEAAGLRHSKA